ncbi:MAG: response regulator [Pirellula sp.]|jgi:DNA-binding response OmpR family regulator|nr:response regulator [Pirellula sp.]
METNFFGASEETSTWAHSPKVLLIEDNPGDVALFKHYLGSAGVKQIELKNVASIAEAEKLLGVESFDSIILDLRLPDADGIEALRRIRRFRQDTPVIILSGNLDTDTASDVIDAGADSYYNKESVRIDSLLLSLKLAIDRSKNSMNTHDNGVDEETGLFNQYGFQNVVEEAFHSACASDSDMCLLWVNMRKDETHVTSMDIIKGVASRIEKSVRSSDYIARLKPSDFLIALPGVGTDRRDQIRSRLLQALSQEVGSELTIQIGCACLDPNSSTLTTLIVQAKNDASVVKSDHA